LGVAFGVLTQLAAFGLILIMFGAISEKDFNWHRGFWGGKRFGLALGTHFCHDEPGRHLHQWRLVRPHALANLFPASGRTLNRGATRHFVAFSLPSASVG
jgi:hypothetical protein